jgi:GWxTD domain-containing protein
MPPQTTGNTLLLIVTIQDINRNSEEEFFVNVNNGSPFNRQAFLVHSAHDSLPLFRNFLTEKDTVVVTYRNNSVKNLYVNYYKRNFPLAAPPFSFDIYQAFDYKPDSIFLFNSDSLLILPNEGFYFFQADTADKNGLTLFRFSNSFPAVNTSDQMVESVRYLTTKKEYEAMKLNENKKEAIERFWLDIGNNADRTRNLIRKYYSRVQEANRFFSSYMEGWRTDRGMIYIIFGKPNNVYKSANAESWIYGSPNNALSLNFFFVKVNNPFTDNDYSLRREPIYEGNWYRAVDVWRQGRVYND